MGELPAKVQGRRTAFEGTAEQARSVKSCHGGRRAQGHRRACRPDRTPGDAGWCRQCGFGIGIGGVRAGDIIRQRQRRGIGICRIEPTGECRGPAGGLVRPMGLSRRRASVGRRQWNLDPGSGHRAVRKQWGHRSVLPGWLEGGRWRDHDYRIGDGGSGLPGRSSRVLRRCHIQRLRSHVGVERQQHGGEQQGHHSGGCRAIGLRGRSDRRVLGLPPDRGQQRRDPLHRA